MVQVKEDLTGKTFGRLVVLSQADDYIASNGCHYACYKCQCTCGSGKITIVHSGALKSKATQSCGCLQKEKTSEIAMKNNKKYNDYEVQEDYVIMYTRKGEPFYVDLEDFWRVKNICWCSNNYGYIMGTIDGKITLLSRYIMNCPPDLMVDHIHAERKYDNRKENLRLATPFQNQHNVGTQKNNTSGVTGVSWNKRRKKWVARIMVNHKRICLGSFEEFDDAVKARKEAEDKYFGEFSYNNSQNIKDVVI